MKNSIKVLLAVLFASTLIISCKEKQEEATEATTEVVPQEAAPVEAPADTANAPK